MREATVVTTTAPMARPERKYAAALVVVFIFIKLAEIETAKNI